MKKLIFGIMLAFFLLGCVMPGEEKSKEPTEEQLEQELEKIPQLEEELITTSGSGDVQVVEIKAAQHGDRWYFPLSMYEDEFLWAGLHSDDFVRINNSHVTLLEDSESIWLTMMTTDGEGVLFNAIYSHELQECDASSVKILGKEYGVSQLGDGPTFENDDKWKVAVESDEDCLKRVIVYMDGYMYEMKDDDQVPLFRNDNTVLFKFSNLDERPEAKVIFTKAVESKKSN